MNSNQFKYYGVIGGDLQITAYIKIACRVVSKSNADEAELLLSELIAVESNNGNATDYSPNYGEGLTQFDKGTFKEVQSYYMNSKFDNMMNRIKLYCLTDIRSASYEDLRKSPMLSVLMARLLFFKLPNAIPTTKQGRWNLYKKYFNSSLGATTKEKYYIASNNSLVKAV